MKSHYMNNILRYFWSDKCYLDFFENLKKIVPNYIFDNLTMFVFLQWCSIAL